MLFDNHNHCQFSFDGKRTTVEATTAEAIRKGLGGLCFTDHCDFFVPPMKADHEDYVSEVFDVVHGIRKSTGSMPLCIPGKYWTAANLKTGMS